MKLTTSKNANLNYLSKIVKIESFKPHPNADRLKLAIVDGCVISTSIDTKEGIFVYFPLECQINHDYLSKNNMYRDKTLNSDQEKTGFFEENRRVKCIKLRGVASEGLIMPLSSLTNFTNDSIIENIDVPVQGTEFDTIDEILFVNKYVPKIKLQQGSGGSKRNKEKKYEELIIENQFRFHDDTAMLKKNLFKFKTDTLIHISHKFHGTSGIFCNLLTKKKLSFYQKFLKFIGGNIITEEYKKFCSSRKVVKDPTLNKGLTSGYYNIDIWNLSLSVIEPFLQKGMSIYAEIVGYTPDGKMIQKDYDYGCKYDPTIYEYNKMTPQQMYDKNLFKIFIYRITHTNVDGKVTEMSAKNLQQYCQNYGLVPVIEDFYGTVFSFVTTLCNHKHGAQDERDFEDLFLNLLSTRYLERECGYCKNKVPAEGIVIRIDNPEFEAYKLKALAFYERETKELDSGEIDIETQES